jgi:hypothetical protein
VVIESSKECDLTDCLSDSYLQCLALLPVSFLNEEGDRFVQLCSQAAIGRQYGNLVTSSIWVYPMHAYRAQIRKHLGAPVAAAVWSRQRGLFEEAEAGAGALMESAFLLIDEALDTGNVSLDSPVAAGAAAPESRVALALLSGMPESPDYSGDRRVREGAPRAACAKVEACLADCLLQAREELLAACSELFAAPVSSH